MWNHGATIREILGIIIRAIHKRFTMAICFGFHRLDKGKGGNIILDKNDNLSDSHN